MFRTLVLLLTFVWTTHLFADVPVVNGNEDVAVFEEPTEFSVEPSQDQTTQEPLAKDDASSHEQVHDALTLVNKLQTLQQEVAELRGRLEEQTHALQLLQEQQLSFYKDLDARLQSSPVAHNKASPVESPPLAPVVMSSTTHMNPADEQVSYLAAYNLIKNKKFEEAQVAMQTFVRQYPQGVFAANAHYWLGELSLRQHHPQEAITHFDIVLKQFPTSTKCSASLLKWGYALVDLGQMDAAKQRLHDVMIKYPDTQVSRWARAKLATL